MKILGNAERGCKRGPANWFTGEVWMDSVVEPTPPSRAQGVLVTFAPGGRTAWHTHPVGQTLYVVSGIGWVQLQGEAARVIRAGDVVVIGPGEVHWHGAEKSRTMVHLAMQEANETGVNVVWGEPVTEEQYALVSDQHAEQ
ncbi:cupin domain-containing protein [Granulicella sp. WH15]|uniref:(R)-mandelonitrile lyase n=1 Tax=Granulicella sp. WH15 TaxID=2602070 RepID=UPI0013671421|nr:cupin domain-containing protein [Granulicella sp. WH15]QHN04440.1 cupin domain-containing protein [Granulicella sp. WH15]